jgi:hypothetical protein
MLEKELQQQIKDYLNFMEVCFIENKQEFSRNRKSCKANKGLPDLQIIHNGRSMFLELKSVGTSSKTYEEQVQWRHKLSKAGCKSHIAYGYDDSVRYIKDFLGLDMENSKNGNI